MSQWSAEEVKLLLEKYPEYATQGKPIYALTDVLPERSANAIEHKLRELRAAECVGPYSDYYSPPQEPQVSNQVKAEVSDAGNKMTVESPRSNRIRSLDDLLSAANVDEDLWQVDRHIINKWEVGAKDEDGNIVTEPLIQVKAWLSPNTGMIAAKAVAREAVYNRISEGAPTEPPQFPDREGKYMAEIGIFDLHLGKYAWGEETGDPYNLDIAEEVYKAAVMDLLGSVLDYMGGPEDLDYFLVPIGNDFVHIDNRKGETSNGTAVADGTDGARWQEISLRAHNLLVWAVDLLRTYAPVQVVVVPGNHDQENAWYLGQLLAAWYRDVDDVEVDNSPSMRKYHLYGNTLIGFTHGKYEKMNMLPMTMATECPALWGNSKYREIHVGHVHYRKALSFQTQAENEGAMVRVLPSLSSSDSWHHKRAFVHGSKAAEAFLFEEDSGLRATFFHRKSQVS